MIATSAGRWRQAGSSPNPDRHTATIDRSRAAGAETMAGALRTAGCSTADQTGAAGSSAAACCSTCCRPRSPRWSRRCRVARSRGARRGAGASAPRVNGAAPAGAGWTDCPEGAPRLEPGHPGWGQQREVALWSRQITPHAGPFRRDQVHPGRFSPRGNTRWLLPSAANGKHSPAGMEDRSPRRFFQGSNFATFAGRRLLFPSYWLSRSRTAGGWGSQVRRPMLGDWWIRLETPPGRPSNRARFSAGSGVQGDQRHLLRDRQGFRGNRVEGATRADHEALYGAAGCIGPRASRPQRSGAGVHRFAERDD